MTNRTVNAIIITEIKRKIHKKEVIKMTKVIWVAKDINGNILREGTKRDIENYLYGRRTYQGIWTDTREKVEE